MWWRAAEAFTPQPRRRDRLRDGAVHGQRRPDRPEVGRAQRRRPPALEGAAPASGARRPPEAAVGEEVLPEWMGRTLSLTHSCGGATPAEVYLDETPAVQNAVPPPRKNARAPTGDRPLPFEVVFLDPERRLPVLIPTHKAA
ncbi:MAG: hypothetical protein ACC742_17325 [Thermoanaerobaculales bacterium]